MLSSPSIYSLVAEIKFTAMRALLSLTSAYPESELCSRVVLEPEMQEWLKLKNPEEKMNYPLTKEIESAIDRFHFNHYCQSFRSGAFARANSSMYVCLRLSMNFIMRIRTFSSPMLNMLGEFMCYIHNVAF